GHQEQGTERPGVPDVAGHGPAVSVPGHGASRPSYWLRAESLTRISRATIAQLVTTEEPPCARNGIAMPASGIRPVTPPATTNTWSARIEARPTARSRPKGSRRARPAR